MDTWKRRSGSAVRDGAGVVHPAMNPPRKTSADTASSRSTCFDSTSILSWNEREVDPVHDNNAGYRVVPALILPAAVPASGCSAEQMGEGPGRERRSLSLRELRPPAGAASPRHKGARLRELPPATMAVPGFEDRPGSGLSTSITGLR